MTRLQLFCLGPSNAVLNCHLFKLPILMRCVRWEASSVGLLPSLITTTHDELIMFNSQSSLTTE